MSKTRFSLLALLITIALSGCVTNRSFGTGIDDQTSDLRLKQMLLADTSYDYSDIDIVIFEGRMMLTGTVRSNDARRSVAQKAGSLPNVTEVLNELIVTGRTSVGQGFRDGVIDERLGAAMLTDNGIYSANYQIAVSQGIVYLLGVAQGPDELARVTGHAQTISGVTNIVSHVIFVGDPRRMPRR